MKSRKLNTIQDLIVSNYSISSNGDGKFTHSFTPENTDTVYSFVANGTPELEAGEHYSIGFYIEDDNKIVDLSCVAKNQGVNPVLSYLFAQQEALDKHAVNKEKNDTRVTHQAVDGYYWGKKYAWREFGMHLPQGAFHAYLKEIDHPTVPCLTINPDLPYASNDRSMAYNEEGLTDAIEALVTSAIRVTPARFESPLYSKRFMIKAISAVTDKK
ncbi:hypothetical protein FM038_004525 [Shewanella eurypsychrophilus]|uniref:Uncharacterized protein n=1 Tax=Shewanella eurypsychrophilus TaxID=2593656 RepID=A0ABX6V4R2_9GAMM|nr:MULTISPECIES: hypothetical protein [Shewanella]QFU21481.1 hypothetical protein FS418_06105 [Shewanella sp. YLB-09]QPG56771.1 hypothetical protein FM038_004525 [Shewanella eurypsychrophilus]